MEDSSKRVLLTVVICSGILFAWYFFMSPPKQQRPLQGSKPNQQQVAEQPLKTPSSQPASRPASKQQAERSEGGTGPRAQSAEGRQISFDTKSSTIKLTDRAASLRSVTLKEPRYKELRKGKMQPVDLVNTLEDKGPWPLVTTFPDSDATIPADAQFKLERRTTTEALYNWESKELRVSKHFVLDRERPIIWMTVTVDNLTPRKLKQRLEVSLYNRQDPNQAKPGFANPYPKILTVQCRVNGEIQRRSAGSISGEESGCSAAGCGMGNGPLSAIGEVLWIGTGDRYFLTAVVPQDAPAERRCELKLLEDNVILAALRYGASSIEAGKNHTWKFAVYAGHKELAALDTLLGPDKSEVHLSESIEYGWFEVICRPMLWLMKQFYAFSGNWGIAIILLTLVVKLLTLYWTQKSMRSMRQMQKLKPKIDILKEKYGDDKQRLNTETMSMYKAHKVSPLGGCLPMVIQMPVWFALYRTLGNAVELYRSPFVGWINDLTAPDPYYVLPIAMGISMYAQQAITPQPMEGTQAKMMKYFMPGMFTVMMLALPAGLTLYIFVNTVLTMLHQYYMNKTDPIEKPSKAEAAAGTESAKQAHQSQDHRKKRAKGKESPATSPKKSKAKRRRRKKK